MFGLLSEWIKEIFKIKITKRQLRRIIKEAKRNLLREMCGTTHPDDVFDSLFQVLDQALNRMGVDRLSDPAAAENVAAALERIAGEIRSETHTEGYFSQIDRDRARDN